MCVMKMKKLTTFVACAAMAGVFATSAFAANDAQVARAQDYLNSKGIAYTVTYGVIKKYLKDPDLLARADKLKKEGKCAHQLFCKEDWNLKRWLWYIRSQLNYYRKTARYYGNKGLRD